MAKTTQKKALIIGGGIAGPAAAIALQRVGIDSVVYEARQTPEQNKGAFLTVARNGINALHTIDAFEAVMCKWKIGLAAVAKLPSDLIFSKISSAHGITPSS